jgi:hypothetical protein
MFIVGCNCIINSVNIVFVKAEQFIMNIKPITN